jgi:hypothetical protein
MELQPLEVVAVELVVHHQVQQLPQVAQVVEVTVELLPMITHKQVA